MGALKSRTVNGVVWSAVERFSTLGIQMVCTLVIAHILTPTDFGLLGMIAVFSAIGLVIIDSGFGLALIRRNDATELDYSSVFYFNILLAFVCYAILYCLSPYIADFYGIPSLTLICRITFLVLPINAFGLIQNTKLVKKIDFRSVAIVSLLSALISGGVGIILAYYLRNVWALVLQNISMYGCRTLLLWCVGHWRPLLQFSFKSIREMMGYSMNLLGFGLVSSLTQNIYPLIIGKIYNATQLGYYSQADRMQKLPATSITEVVQRVCFPVLAEIKDDIKRMREAYRQIILTTFFIVFPLMMLLLGIADELFILLMGNQWGQAAVYFKILCVFGSLYPLHSINLNILNVVGKSRLSLILEITRKIILALCLVLAMNYDIIVFIWMQVVYGIIVLFINLFFCGKEISYGVYSQMKDILPTILLSAISLGVICLADVLLPFQNALSLISKCILFMALYLFMNYGLKTQALAFTYSVIINLIKKNK